MGFQRADLILLLILCIVSSGCASLTVTQDLEKDGTSDFRIEAEGNEVAVSSIEKRLNSSRIALENAEDKQRAEGYFSYNFSDVPADSVKSGTGSEFNIKSDYRRDKGIIYDKFVLNISSPGRTNFGEKESFGLRELISDSSSVSYKFNYFGTLLDTNGEVKTKNGEKYVLMDLTKEEDYFVKFKAFKPSLVYANLFSDGGCSSDFSCKGWSRCEGGKSERECSVASGCKKYMFEPVKTKNC